MQIIRIHRRKVRGAIRTIRANGEVCIHSRGFGVLELVPAILNFSIFRSKDGRDQKGKKAKAATSRRTPISTYETHNQTSLFT